MIKFIYFSKNPTIQILLELYAPFPALKKPAQSGKWDEKGTDLLLIINLASFPLKQKWDGFILTGKRTDLFPFTLLNT